MALAGGCYCGALKFEIRGEIPMHAREPMRNLSKNIWRRGKFAVMLAILTNRFVTLTVVQKLCDQNGRMICLK
jgi:hypothetical protein